MELRRDAVIDISGPLVSKGQTLHAGHMAGLAQDAPEGPRRQHSVYARFYPRGVGAAPGRTVSKAYGLSQLGEEGGAAAGPETILTSTAPGPFYVKALQGLFGVEEAKRTGVWDKFTHDQMVAWLGRFLGAEDLTRTPSFGEDPLFTAAMTVEVFLAGLKSDGAFAAMGTFYADLGLPGSRSEVVGMVTSPSNTEKARRALDRVMRYIASSEGGSLLSDDEQRMVRYRGMASAGAALGIPLLIIAVV